MLPLPTIYEAKYPFNEACTSRAALAQPCNHCNSRGLLPLQRLQEHGHAAHNFAFVVELLVGIVEYET